MSIELVYDEVEDAMEEAYNGWRGVWELDDMTPREIYEIGFQHGFEAAGS